jgi:hypothetical protein
MLLGGLMCATRTYEGDERREILLRTALRKSHLTPKNQEPERPLRVSLPIRLSRPHTGFAIDSRTTRPRLELIPALRRDSIVAARA